MEIRTHKDGELCQPYEYFCTKELTLNLSLIKFDKCPGCGADIIKGRIGKLDHDALKEQYGKTQPS